MVICYSSLNRLRHPHAPPPVQSGLYNTAKAILLKHKSDQSCPLHRNLQGLSIPLRLKAKIFARSLRLSTVCDCTPSPALDLSRSLFPSLILLQLKPEAQSFLRAFVLTVPSAQKTFLSICRTHPLTSFGSLLKHCIFSDTFSAYWIKNCNVLSGMTWFSILFFSSHNTYYRSYRFNLL